jgi:hypothetical protein
MENIARDVARGGSARRAGLALAQKMAVTEANNRQLSDGLWAARNNLEVTRTSIMQGNIKFANAWVDNQSGIRDTYTQALTNLRVYWSGIAPALLGANTAAAGQAHTANQNATDALMESAQTRANAISGAAQYIGGAITKYAAPSDPAITGTGGGAGGAAGALYGPNPTSADY